MESSQAILKETQLQFSLVQNDQTETAKFKNCKNFAQDQITQHHFKTNHKKEILLRKDQTV